MKLREYHPLSEMERVPAEELPKRLDELFDRMDRRMLALLLRRREKTPVSSAPTSGLNSSTRQLKLR